MEQEVKKGSLKTAYILGIAGVVATLLMAIAVVYYWEWVRALEGYGYLGAFLISIYSGWCYYYRPGAHAGGSIRSGRGNELYMVSRCCRRFG